MIARAFQAMVLLTVLPAMAEAPNPLLAPLPRGAKSAGATPESQIPLPATPPMYPVNLRPTDAPQPKESRRTFAVAGAAVDMQRDWFVSAIVGSSAILRQRIDASTGTASSGGGQLRPGGVPFPGNGAPQSAQNGPAETKVASPLSLMVSDGEETYVIGLPVQARVHGDIVSLTWLEGGTRIVVFQAGVEPSQVVRAERRTTEQPDPAFASGSAPGVTSGSSVPSANAQTQPAQTPR